MSGAKAFIEKNCNSLAKQFLFLFIYALRLAMYLIKWKHIPPKMLNRVHSQMLYAQSNEEGHAMYDFLIMGTQFKALMEY